MDLKQLLRTPPECLNAANPAGMKWSNKSGYQVRARVKIKLPFWALRRPSGKARGRRIAGYLTDEQRRQAEWISVQNGKFILTRALKVVKMPLRGEHHKRPSRLRIDERIIRHMTTLNPLNALLSGPACIFFPGLEPGQASDGHYRTIVFAAHRGYARTPGPAAPKLSNPAQSGTVAGPRHQALAGYAGRRS